jgi:hypothetical protein
MKASEVFDLPLEAHQESAYQQDGAGEYLYEFSVAEFNTPEQAKVAEVCINHADALADALESLLPIIDTHRELAVPAAKALAAYRGEK